MTCSFKGCKYAQHGRQLCPALSLPSHHIHPLFDTLDLSLCPPFLCKMGRVKSRHLFLETFLWSLLLLPELFSSLFILRIWEFCMCVCLSPHVYSAWGGQKRALDALRLELQTAVWATIWVLGITPGPSARAASALNHQFQRILILGFVVSRQNVINPAKQFQSWVKEQR